mmetsp:Transcript_24249/g.33379  ORF Transcript_24249/g.33379 Transcript_24249/m.33379 type:complete len:243 (-) Transcript_24249:415-1143(-)
MGDVRHMVGDFVASFRTARLLPAVDPGSARHTEVGNGASSRSVQSLQWTQQDFVPHMVVGDVAGMRVTASVQRWALLSGASSTEGASVATTRAVSASSRVGQAYAYPTEEASAASMRDVWQRRDQEATAVCRMVGASVASQKAVPRGRKVGSGSALRTVGVSTAKSKGAQQAQGGALISALHTGAAHAASLPVALRRPGDLARGARRMEVARDATSRDVPSLQGLESTSANLIQSLLSTIIL